MKPVDIGQWSWSKEKNGRVVVEAKGYRLEQIHSGGHPDYPSLWVLDVPEGSQEDWRSGTIDWRSKAPTALLRLACAVTTGMYRDLIMRDFGELPSEVRDLYSAYRDTYEKLNNSNPISLR